MLVIIYGIPFDMCQCFGYMLSVLYKCRNNRQTKQGISSCVVIKSHNVIKIEKNVMQVKGIDGSLTIVDIDASKGFVDLWVHFFVAIENIHRNGY